MSDPTPTQQADTNSNNMTTTTTTTKPKYNLTVLISGSGTNLQALIDATGQTTKTSPAPLSNALITRVISNKKDAYGLTRATNSDIPTTYHNLVSGGYKKKYPDPSNIQQAREEYDADLARLIIDDTPRPDLVVCAGWMHILSHRFVDAMKSANIPVINLHPALPGQFDGANAIGRAWEAYRRGEIRSTGVMIHYVIGEVDRGEPIVTREVGIEGCASEDELEGRIHEVEWGLIVEGVGRVLSGLQEGDGGVGVGDAEDGV